MTGLVPKASRYRAFAAFDALFSTLPVLLMLFYALSASASLAKGAEERMAGQEAFDKLVSIADYVVKRGAATKLHSDFGEPAAMYPNWIDEGALAGLDTGTLAGKAGLRSLHIALDEPGESGACIYRIVASGPDRGSLRIRRLFVCGE